MADVPVTVALLVLSQNYRGRLIPQVNRRCMALRTLRIVPGAGQNVAFGAQKGGAIAENYSEGADATNFGSDGEVPVLIHWGLYRAPFSVTEHARRVASTTATPEGVENLVANKMMASNQELADKINKELYTGLGTGTLMAGFDVAIGDDNNSYGGIDRSDAANAFWRPKVIDPGSLTSPTFALVRRDLGQIKDQGGESPDLAYVSTSVYNTLAGLFDDNRSFTQDITTGRGPIKLESSAKAIDIDGCMFVPDKDCPANAIYYVNTNYVEIEYLPPDPRVLAELASMGVQMLADDGYGPIPLGIVTEKLGRTGARDKYESLATLQLKVMRPNTCGVRLNVAVAA